MAVVLAHGGWADGSSWSKVILPLTTLADDVAALAPDEGEGVGEVFSRVEPHPLAPALEQALLAATQRPLALAAIGATAPRAV